MTQWRMRAGHRTVISHEPTGVSLDSGINVSVPRYPAYPQGLSSTPHCTAGNRGDTSMYARAGYFVRPGSGAIPSLFQNTQKNKRTRAHTPRKSNTYFFFFCYRFSFFALKKMVNKHQPLFHGICFTHGTSASDCRSSLKRRREARHTSGRTALE